MFRLDPRSRCNNSSRCCYFPCPSPPLPVNNFQIYSLIISQSRVKQNDYVRILTQNSCTIFESCLQHNPRSIRTTFWSIATFLPTSPRELSLRLARRHPYVHDCTPPDDRISHRPNFQLLACGMACKPNYAPNRLIFQFPYRFGTDEP